MAKAWTWTLIDVHVVWGSLMVNVVSRVVVKVLKERLNNRGAVHYVTYFCCTGTKRDQNHI